MAKHKHIGIFKKANYLKYDCEGEDASVSR